MEKPAGPIYWQDRTQRESCHRGMATLRSLTLTRKRLLSQKFFGRKK